MINIIIVKGKELGSFRGSRKRSKTISLIHLRLLKNQQISQFRNNGVSSAFLNNYPYCPAETKHQQYSMYM